LENAKAAVEYHSRKLISAFSSSFVQAFFVLVFIFVPTTRKSPQTASWTQDIEDSSTKSSIL
jgi:hypothetical protein